VSRLPRSRKSSVQSLRRALSNPEIDLRQLREKDSLMAAREIAAKRAGVGSPDRSDPARELFPELRSYERQIGILKSVLESLPSGAIIADAEGKFTFFNAAAELILGIGLRDLDPALWSSEYGCFMPDQVTHYPTERLPLARSLKGEEVLFEEIFIRNEQRSDGVWLNVSSKPLRSSSGELLGAYVVFQDVTDYKKSAAIVERLSSAVEQTADSVVITNIQGIIRYVNPAFEKTTGYSREEVVGQTPRVLKSGEHAPEFYKELWETVLGGGVFSATITNRRKNGDLYWAEQTITPMREQSGRITHFVSVWKDVTEQRKLQEQEFHLKMAREVQQRFYVKAAPHITDFDLTGRAFPADQTGGDYFDFIPMLDGCIGIAIGDVVGHGYAAALLMAELRAYMRMVAAAELEPANVLNRVGEILYGDLDKAQLITLLMVRLDPRTGMFTYASAGHVPGYLMDASGVVEQTLGATGIPLGIDPHAKYDPSPAMKLAPGKVLTLLTDGIAETMSADEIEFGTDRILELIGENRAKSAVQIADSLYAAAREHAEGRPQQDDITCVVCKAKQAP
jgi:sigma-B regulation protein RsbU (phosphoserine phosphatase)